MLVTIVVVTYNSSKYVLQTLESTYRQTYGEIELIVSDDCSTDETYSMCEDWIRTHRQRYYAAHITRTQFNGGICWNYNHALSLATGEYIKYIAGDDILENNCIERFVANIRNDTFLYTCSTGHLNDKTQEITSYCTPLPNSNALAQTRKMLKNVYAIEGSSLFFETKHLRSLGGFDMRFPMLEDWPIAMRYLTSNLRISVINEQLVRWRVYDESISHSNELFSKSLGDSVHYYQRNFSLKSGLIFYHYYYWLKDWISKNHNRGTRFKILGCLLRCVDLVHQYRKFFPLTYFKLNQIK